MTAENPQPLTKFYRCSMNTKIWRIYSDPVIYLLIILKAQNPTFLFPVFSKLSEPNWVHWTQGAIDDSAPQVYVIIEKRNVELTVLNLPYKNHVPLFSKSNRITFFYTKVG